jgi:hypothetical protein
LESTVICRPGRIHYTSNFKDESTAWLVWLVLELAVTATAFFLLWGKRWKSLPPSRERTDLIFGYFVVSWLLSLFPGFMGIDYFYYIFVLGYAIFILVIYRQHQKALAASDEMFP